MKSSCFTASLRVLIFTASAWLAAPLFQPRANAHPYASGITNSGANAYYVLNENADDVKVRFDNGTTLSDTGAQAKGSHSFALGAHSNYSIVVTKSGTGTPSQISVDTNLTDFYGPRAVAVNRNPASHYFGRTYILNASAGFGNFRPTQRGVYVLNADQSDALGYGTNAYPTIGTATNQIQYGSSTTYGPYKIFVGPDDSVYVADGSGGNGSGTIGGGVWWISPDLTSTIDLFKFSGATSATGLYCVPGTPNVTGSIAAGNLVLYTTEWNRTPYNNIWKYALGNGPFPSSNAPVQLGTAGIGTINQVLADLYIAPDGKFFTCEHRSSATGGNVTLRVYASDGVTALWDSSSAGGGTDPFYNSYGMAVSPDDQYVATGTDAGNINVCKLTNGIPDLSTLTVINAGFGGECAGVAWDVADNVYGVSGTDDLLRVFSLGLSTTSVTGNDLSGTNGNFQFTVGAVASNLPPNIVTQPQSQTVLTGTTASFSVAATGTAPLNYQWSFNNTPLSDNSQYSGTHTNALTLATATSASGGNYTVIISNAYGAATSSVAVLTVTTTAPLPIGWSQLTNTPGSSTVRHDDVYFTDPTNGWASQNNSIYRTTNGGYTWTTNLTLVGTHFRSIGFATPLIGFGGNLGVGSYDGGVTDTNVLYRTVDGGVTWSNVPGFAEAGMKGLCSIFVLDSQHIYGAGRVRGPAYFIKSTNGGFNWTLTSLTASNVMNGIMDIYFSDPTNGWVVGMDTNQYASPPYYGRIARTTDGGATWNTVITTPISNSYFWKMSWPSTNIGYVSLQQNAGYSNVVFYKTTNGGASWFSNAIPLASVGLGSSQFYLQGLGFVSTNEGWVGGSSGYGYPGSFLHTVDGGANWTTAGFNNTYLINRIRFLNQNLGFASGANVYIYNQPLVITNQPQPQVAVQGSGVQLSVGVSSQLPTGYQWQLNGTNIGVTNAVLSIPKITRSSEGIYSVIITNANATLQSSNILVRILAAERLAPPVLLPGGQLQLLFNDADGGALLTTNDVATFQVLVSTNLVTWSVLTNALTLTNGSMILHDTWTNSPNRFYRVVEH